MVTSSSAAASPPTADDTNAAAVSLPTIQPASPTEPVQTSSIQQLQEPTQQGPASTSSSGGSGGSGSSSGQTFSGDGTYYTPGLGSCGKTNTESDLIAAINAPQYGTNANPNSAPVCGKCALVKGPNGQVKVTITDRCPVCKSGDLDLSPAAFTQIGDLNAGRISITWSFVDC
ncbi:RlpA-like double-psi beta-barrel-protein domain-containing protein-containing protein [Coemansia spiralis]|nr:RlpA-like double-psi beta-barrel-protein domain-containing protein-containing protein [Coemansia spiralis]